jgi:hypothetical protein
VRGHSRPCRRVVWAQRTAGTSPAFLTLGRQVLRRDPHCDAGVDVGQGGDGDRRGVSDGRRGYVLLNHAGDGREHGTGGSVAHS